MGGLFLLDDPLGHLAACDHAPSRADLDDHIVVAIVLLSV